MIHTIENEMLRVQIADAGAELVSVFDKKREVEIMWQADPAYWKRHAPVLFPNVGRHFHNTYRVGGGEYTSKQHGFARDMEFTCVSSSKHTVTHCLKSSPETLAEYPFDFELFIIHTLTDNQVSVNWIVKNPGQETMYFTIGGHPAFRVPVMEGTSFTDYQLGFDGQDSLTYLLLDPSSGTAYLDKTGSLSLINGVCPLTEHMFDSDALVFDHQIEKASLLLPDGSPYVELCCKGFPNFGIWSVPGAPFVCLEPWMGRCDNYGFHGVLSEKPDINSLESQGLWEAAYSIRFF